MSDWNGILKEIQETQSQVDFIRRKYIKNLSALTKRNTITYYSGWLTKQNGNNFDINDSDMTGFMSCVHGLDCEKGLDLILHTPGGSPAAAEMIVNYLRNKFNNNIRVIVPQLAMPGQYHGPAPCVAVPESPSGVQARCGLYRPGRPGGHRGRVHRAAHGRAPLFRRAAPGAGGQGACDHRGGESDPRLHHLSKLFPHV